MKQVSIRVQLMTAAGVTLALTIGLSYAALSSIGTLHEGTQELANFVARKAIMAGELKATIEQMRVHQRGTVAYSAVGRPEEARASERLYQEASGKLAALTSELDPMLKAPRARQALKAIRDGNTEWQPLHDEVVRLCMGKAFDERLVQGMARTVSVTKGMTTAMDDLVEVQRGLLTEGAAKAEASASLAGWIVGVVVGLSILVGLGLLLIARSVAVRLSQMSTKLATATSEVSSASTQVAAASQALAQNSSELATSIEETASTTEEIASLTKRGAEDAHEARETMRQASSAIDEANRVLEEMVVSMREIGASSDKISKIIKAIDEIAFQTNILALNAAVEAARAGEAGMGFAVVAEEVRNLSQRSAQAARDTSALIEESITKSAGGTAKLEQVTKAIARITTSAAQVQKLVEDVTQEAAEEARGTQQILVAVRQMEQLTQRNASNAEESAAAGSEMSAQANSLRQLAADLEAMV